MDARGASPPSEATSSVAEQCRRESHEALFRARSETVASRRSAAWRDTSGASTSADSEPKKPQHAIRVAKDTLERDHKYLDTLGTV